MSGNVRLKVPTGKGYRLQCRISKKLISKTREISVPVKKPITTVR
jgi:hypothetical protein